jgi:hypothetical protein
MAQRGLDKVGKSKLTADQSDLLDQQLDLLNQINQAHEDEINKIEAKKDQYQFIIDLVRNMNVLYEETALSMAEQEKSQQDISNMLFDQKKKLEEVIKIRKLEQDLMSGLSEIQNEINEKINISTNLASQFKKEGEAMFAGKTFQPIVSSLKNIANRFGEAGAERQRLLDESIKKLREEGKTIEAAMLEFQGTSLGQIFMNVGPIIDTIYQKLKSVLIPVFNILIDSAKSFVKAIGQIPGILLEVTKSTFIFSKVMLEKLGSMTQAIIAIPLNVLEKAQELGYEIKKEMNDFAQTFENLQKDFVGGDFIGQGFKRLQGNLIGARKEFMNVNTEAVHLFGRGITGINKAFQETQSIVKSLGVFTSLFADQITKNKENAFYYFKMKQVFDMTDEDLQYIARTASNTGKSLATVFQSISESIDDAAKVHRQDAKQMARDYLDMRKNVISFGHITDKELGNVVARTRQMRVEMKDAVSLFEKVQTFEDAANMSSQLSQSFNMVVDSMELLKAESPDQMLKMLRDAMFATGRSFEQMNRFEKSLLQQQTGLSSEAMQALFSFQNVGKSYSQIMDDMNAKDPVQQQIKGINQMKDAIVELKETMPKFQNSFDAFFTGLKDNVLLSSDVRKELADVSFSFDSLYNAGLNKNIKNLQPAIKSVLNLISNIKKALTDSGFLQSISNITLSFANIINYFLNPALITAPGAIAGSVTKELDDIVKNVKPIFEKLFKISFELIKSSFAIFVKEFPSLISSLFTYISDIFVVKSPITGQTFAQELIFSFKTGFQSLITEISKPTTQATLITAITQIFSFGKELFMVGIELSQQLIAGIITDLKKGPASSQILTAFTNMFTDIKNELFAKVTTTSPVGTPGGILARVFGSPNDLITSFKNIASTIIPIMEDIVVEVTDYAVQLLTKIAEELSDFANKQNPFDIFDSGKWNKIAGNLIVILDKLFLDTGNSIVASLFKLADKFFDYLGSVKNSEGESLSGIFMKIVGSTTGYFVEYYKIIAKEFFKNFGVEFLAIVTVIGSTIYGSMKAISSMITSSITRGAQIHGDIIEKSIISAASKMYSPSTQAEAAAQAAGGSVSSKAPSKGMSKLSKAGMVAGTLLTVSDILGVGAGNKWMEGLQSAAELGMTGATIGSFFGPVGTAVGGVLGATIGGVYSMMNDGFISKDGKVVKIHDNDNVIAFKENGPILNSATNASNSSLNQSQMIKPEDLKAAVRDAIIEGFKSQNQKIEVKLNGEKVGEGLLASGFVNMMTNANKTKGAPTINPNTVIYRDGQIPSSGYISQ